MVYSGRSRGVLCARIQSGMIPHEAYDSIAAPAILYVP